MQHTVIHAQAQHDHGRPIDNVLPRLLGEKKTATDRWHAKCLAHDDRGPSLSIREASDGTVLLHCFAGCTLKAVLASLGISLRDLFPKAADSRGPVDWKARSPRQAKPVKLPARWFDLENYSDDPLWRMFVARACEERAWRCNVEPFEIRDAAKRSPVVALAIIRQAAVMLRKFARSEGGV